MEAWRRELYHEGVSKRDGAKVGSGRYPLGSGERPRSINNWNEPIIEKKKNTQTPLEVTSEETRKVIDSSKQNIRELSNIYNRHKKHKRIDLSEVPDAEIQRRINRLSLEQRYYDLVKPPDKIERGFRDTESMLTMIGNVASIAVSAATFLAIMNKVNNG